LPLIGVFCVNKFVIDCEPSRWTLDVPLRFVFSRSCLWRMLSPGMWHRLARRNVPSPSAGWT
jgi:hypothetical protein